MAKPVQLGDEAPVSDTDPRMLRVVRLRPGEKDCDHCALSRGALGLCATGHPLDCVNFGGLLYEDYACAVFVDDIPRLAMKGQLA